MNMITKAQIIRIHILLNELGFQNDKDYKASLVREFTNGRETSTTGMRYYEADELLKALAAATYQNPKLVASDAMRKKILHYAHNMGYVVNGRVDVKHVDNWCKSHGYLHKGLNEYTYEELPALVTQYQNVYKSYLKGIQKQ